MIQGFIVYLNASAAWLEYDVPDAERILVGVFELFSRHVTSSEHYQHHLPYHIRIPLKWSRTKLRLRIHSYSTGLPEIIFITIYRMTRIPRKKYIQPKSKLPSPQGKLHKFYTAPRTLWQNSQEPSSSAVAQRPGENPPGSLARARTHASCSTFPAARRITSITSGEKKEVGIRSSTVAQAKGAGGYQR